MSRYIVIKSEGGEIVNAWGTFPTPDAAVEWLARDDPRFEDHVWDKNGDRWFAEMEEGDMEHAHFRIRPLEEPTG